MLALAALAVVRFGLTLSLGPEWDSNANRAEVVAGAESPDQPVSSFLLRTTANARLTWKTDKSILRITVGAGGKIYFDPAVFDQDVLAISIAAEERVRVARFLHVALLGDYYDAWQLPVAPYRARDFRSGAALARIYFVDPLGEVALTGGYRGFQYKPDPYFDFQAAQATAYGVARLVFGANGEHELDVGATYHLERRWFNGVVQLFQPDPSPPAGQTGPMPPCAYGQSIQDRCLVAGSDQRMDWFHEGGVEITYVGPLLVGVGYGLQLNLSNSFGQSLLRHIVTLKIGYRLPWQIYATVKAQLYASVYLDPVLLDRAFNTQQFITIEDENRNNVIVDLERPLGDTGLALNARYSVFTNEITPSPVSFLRQVVYLGLTYRVGAR
ncbi:MAG TPA: hypothetical protein VN947_35780 [Polyangia bacterium]|nr:hypothetical protein [Polyangia bacterium]